MTENTAILDSLLRSCVECGLCLPHCATFLATGNEVQSPRGRLLLLAEHLRAPQTPPPAAFLTAFDLCLGCRACETVCPSGVPFELLAHGKSLADARPARSAAAGGSDPGIAWLLRRLDSPTFLATVRRAGSAARNVCGALLGRHWRQRLDRGPAPVAAAARLLGVMPHSPAADPVLAAMLDRLVAGAGRLSPEAPGGRALANAQDPRPRPVQFFAGCANAGLLPSSSRRLQAVLAAAGYQVSVPAGQDCCGALAAHTGRPGRAAQLAARNERSFKPAETAAVPDPIVVEAAGCGHHLQGAGSPLAGRVLDAASLLVTGPLPRLRPVPLRVVLHDPCHARHGMRVTAPTRQLLSAIPGLDWCEAPQAEVCCGGAGAWGIQHAELSAELGRLKAQELAGCGADLVVTTNPGCLGQIADGLALVAPDLPILPLTDLLWYALADRP